MTVVIRRGLPDTLRTQAAELYWEAFGGKLGRVMGPKAKALAFLEESLRGDHAIVALSQDGHLLGVVGFKTIEGSFAGGNLAQFQTYYGYFGAMWRGALLELLERDVENQRFLLDGICVAEAARGTGVGTLLLDAICTEARARNYTAVRLDVIDANPRARALYQRFGFEAVKTEHLGVLRFIFGFSRSVAMVKQL